MLFHDVAKKASNAQKNKVRLPHRGVSCSFNAATTVTTVTIVLAPNSAATEATSTGAPTATSAGAANAPQPRNSVKQRADLHDDELDRNVPAVNRQLTDVPAQSTRRVRPVPGINTDTARSLTRPERRPEDEPMLSHSPVGRDLHLVASDVARPANPGEPEEITNLAHERDSAVAVADPAVAPATPEGETTAGSGISASPESTEARSRRMQRQFQDRAENGEPHSFAAFGYRRTVERDEHGKRTGAHDELDPEQAEVIRQAARLLLAGRSLRSTAAHLNDIGAPTPRGKPWQSATLRQVLLRERNAGRRVHRGQVIGDGRWAPLYSADTHDRVLTLLTDPSRNTTNSNVPRHLLTGIAQCGLCGEPLVARQGRVAGNGRRQASAYACAKCLKVRRKEAAVDERVENYLTNWLQRPDILAAIGQDRHQHPPKPTASSTATPAANAEFEVGPAPKHPAWLLLPDLADLIGPHAPQNWSAAPLETKRALIKAVCSVTVMPTKPGPHFDPDSVVIRPR